MAPPYDPKFWENFLEEIFAKTTVPTTHYKTLNYLTTTPKKIYLEKIFNVVLKKEKPEDIELYLWFCVLEDMMPYTTDTMLKFYSDYAKSVRGVATSFPRSTECVYIINEVLGMALSYRIANSEFLNETKPKVEAMIGYLHKSFYELVDRSEWMDPENKGEAVMKAKRIVNLIGFPEWILDKTALESYYEGVKVNKSDYLDSLLALAKREMFKTIGRLGERRATEWETTPATVKALYSPLMSMTVPWAILQFPFYGLGLEALNYAALGSVLGHELTHGFDNTGRMINKYGNFGPWWSDKTITEFEKRAKCFESQYSAFELSRPNIKIDGKRTLDENIADNGGIRQAYMAYQKFVEKNGKEKLFPGLTKYTPEQLFFLSYGNMWCETLTDESKYEITKDAHSPGQIRVTGVLQNFPEFARAFNCKAKDKMKPENVCRIW